MKNFPLTCWRHRGSRSSSGGVEAVGWSREGRRRELRGQGGAEEGGRGVGHGGEWEGKEEGRGGGPEMAVLWGPSSPCLSACLWGSKGGDCPSGPQIVRWKRPGIGQEEATCVGMSRVVAAHWVCWSELNGQGQWRAGGMVGDCGWSSVLKSRGAMALGWGGQCCGLDASRSVCLPCGQLVKNPPATWKTWVWPLGWEYPLEKRMATHSSILAWRIPWTV